MRPERALGRQWLVLEHIETGASEASGSERLDQRRFVDDRLRVRLAAGRAVDAPVVFMVGLPCSGTSLLARRLAANVVLNLYRSNDELLVTISDDGRGIRAEDMDKAESLGLVGMRERVWAMGGEITIAGDEPPGTRPGAAGLRGVP